MLERRCPWKLDHTEKIALVFLGNKRGGHGAADAACPERQRHKKKYGNRNLANQPSADGDIAICCSVENFVEAPEERSQRSACLFAGAEKERAERRAEREGVEGRDEHRHRHGHGELLIHRTGDAGNENCRNEHRRQNERDGDHGSGNLRHSLEGGIPRTQPLLDMRLDGFDHDDGVIHHQADGQHHAEKREGIDRKPKHWKKSKGSDEGNRHGDERNECCAPALEENEDDEYDECHGLEERLDDFLDAIGDGEGGIECDRVLKSRGELLRLLFEEGPNLFHRIHRIRAGELVDGNNRRILALEAPANIVNLAAEFDTGDILDSYNRTVWIGTNNDVFKLLGRGEAPGSGDGESENLSLGNRLASDLSCRVHFVLRADRLNDFWNRDVESGEAVGLHPDTHRVFARAEDTHAADARDTGERIVDVDIGVVRQKGGIELPAGRGENENAEG